MTVPMQALKSFPYAGKRLAVLQEFSARGESDARVLEAVGLATRHVQVQVRAITDPVPVASQVKRGRGYRKQALEAQPSSEAAPDTSRQGASEPQGSEHGNAEKPEAGNLETAPPAEQSAPPAEESAPTRRRYVRRDLSGDAG